jgi:thiamine biosynthesis protein ThiS
VRITVNGESHDLETSVSVDELLRSLRVAAARVAVEINEEVVPRATYPQRRVVAGDRVEIVQFVGGG